MAAFNLEEQKSNNDATSTSSSSYAVYEAPQKCALSLSQFKSMNVNLHGDKRSADIICCSPNNAQILLPPASMAPLLAFYTVAHTSPFNSSDNKKNKDKNTIIMSTSLKVVVSYQWIVQSAEMALALDECIHSSHTLNDLVLALMQNFGTQSPPIRDLLRLLNLHKFYSL